MGKNKPSPHQKAASKETAKLRANNPQPKGVQMHHWNQVLEAEKAGMPFGRMNKNISPMQSHTDKPATTLLTSKNGTSGTQYTVHEKVLPNGELSPPKETNGQFGAEHKFADSHMIPTELNNSKAANPKMNQQDRIETAGGTAAWKMLGDPGKVSKHLMEKINLAVPAAVKGLMSKLRANNRAAGPKTAPAKPGGAKSNKSSSAPKASSLRASKPGSAAAKPAGGSAKVGSAPKAAPSAPKPAGGGPSNTSSNA